MRTFLVLQLEDKLQAECYIMSDSLSLSGVSNSSCKLQLSPLGSCSTAHSQPSTSVFSVASCVESVLGKREGGGGAGEEERSDNDDRQVCPLEHLNSS